MTSIRPIRGDEMNRMTLPETGGRGDDTISLRDALAHVRTRRRALISAVDIWGDFATWEESCIPSYCHPNRVAAAVSWMRLFAAAKMARDIALSGPILDFGASTGELGHLVASSRSYHFIEQDAAPASYLRRALPNAHEQTLESAPPNNYACVFALDSLEHNDNFAELLDALAAKLLPEGVLILSGPTENWLYRLGRRIAGFDSHYHKTTIAHIEDAAARRMTKVAQKTVPVCVPLFKLSAWRVTSPARQED
jgi:hypothetical protein